MAFQIIQKGAMRIKCGRKLSETLLRRKKNYILLGTKFLVEEFKYAKGRGWGGHGKHLSASPKKPILIPNEEFKNAIIEEDNRLQKLLFSL